MQPKTLLTPDNKKKIKDLTFNVSAILILNLTIQFLLYPFIQRKLGTEAYGVALSLFALVSITANTFGTAGNYSRMVQERKSHPANGDYNIFLVLGGLLSAGVGAAFLWWLDLFTLPYLLAYSFLMLATTFRYYADVEFKLNINFFRYFLFYLLISLGYVLGLLVYRLTDNFLLAVLTGEMAGVLFSMFASGIYRRPFHISGECKTIWASLLFLTFSLLFENLTLNADRLVLLALSDGEAVSIYYTASLLGKVVAILTVPINALVISYLVRYDKGLSKKLWSLFAGGALLAGVVALGGCMLGSFILIPFLYPDLYELAKPFFFASIASQIFYFVSGVLVTVLLRFRGEKKQFFFNLGYGLVFFACTIVGTRLWGLWGFVFASLLANALRFLCVILWGFLPARENAADARS